jgi:hypothetical protein
MTAQVNLGRSRRFKIWSVAVNAAAFLSGGVCQIKSEVAQFGDSPLTAVTQLPNHPIA